MNDIKMSVLQRVWQAALVLLAAALAARIAWEVLRPILPALVLVVVLLGIYGFMLRGRRY